MSTQKLFIFVGYKIHTYMIKLSGKKYFIWKTKHSLACLPGLALELHLELSTQGLSVWYSPTNLSNQLQAKKIQQETAL